MTETEAKRLKELSDAVEENKLAIARAHELIDQLRRKLEVTQHSTSASQHSSSANGN